MCLMSRKLGTKEEIPMIPPTVPEVKVGILSEIQDYNHELLNIPAAWKSSMGSGVKVAVLDTGMPQHPDMTVEGSSSFIPGYLADENGHGTASGSVIAAIANNGMGIRGVAPDVSDYYGAVLGKYGTGSIKSIIDGIYWAADDIKADVINMSLGIPGSYECDPELKKACDYAYEKGSLLVASAGNDGKEVNYPARFDSVVAVAAVDHKSKLASFSSRGPEVEFAAGGVDVYMCYLNGGYASMSGTSFSAPVIAGVACLIKSIFRGKGIDLTPEELRGRLKKIAYDVGPAGRDEMFGYGIPVFTKNAENLFTGEAGVLGRQSFWKRLWNRVLMLAGKEK